MTKYKFIFLNFKAYIRIYLQNDFYLETKKLPSLFYYSIRMIKVLLLGEIKILGKNVDQKV